MIVYAIKNSGGQYIKVTEIKYKEDYEYEWVDSIKNAGFVESEEFCRILIRGYNIRGFPVKVKIEEES